MVPPAGHGPAAGRAAISGVHGGGTKAGGAAISGVREGGTKASILSLLFFIVIILEYSTTYAVSKMLFMRKE
jgi:hypothetical protein